MENLMLYFLKANGLIITFYLVYVLFLRSETFFSTNRWYFISGLLLSLVLPLFTFTRTIWVDPIPVTRFHEETIAKNNNLMAVPLQETPFDWSLFAMWAYLLISVLLICKIGMELASFFKKIHKQTKRKESGYTLVATQAIENPFSFFKYIVINTDQFTETEFQFILKHERIHVQQLHSFDVLLSKLFCALLWINPFIWHYRKVMLQNLEFIADSATMETFENKYEYQKTLLKVVTHHSNLSITNQFYQSLIKKRIIMLHTNQSDKKMAWKYVILFPLLVGFVLLFQIKTVAQIKVEKNAIKEVIFAKETVQLLITKHTTDEEIQKEVAQLKKEYQIEINISNIKRNTSNEIIAISISYKDAEGNSGKLTKKSKNPIESILFYKEIDSKGNGKIGFGNQEMTDFVAKNSESINWNDAKSLSTVEIRKSGNDEMIYIINGKEYSKEEMKDKIVELDGAITINDADKGGKKVMIFKGKSTFLTEPQTILYLDDTVISEDEMKKIDAENIKSVDINKNNINNEIKIVTKNSNGISEDTEIYINGKKSSKEALDKLNADAIESVNVTNNNGKKSIEIQKRNTKMIQGGSWTEVEKEIELSKKEMEKAKIELEKAKAEMKVEIEKAKAEMEKAKADMEKAKADMEKARSKRE